MCPTTGEARFTMMWTKLSTRCGKQAECAPPKCQTLLVTLVSTCLWMLLSCCAVVWCGVQVFGDGAVRTGSNWSLLNPLSPVWGRIMAARWAKHQGLTAASGTQQTLPLHHAPSITPSQDLSTVFQQQQLSHRALHADPAAPGMA